MKKMTVFLFLILFVLCSSSCHQNLVKDSLDSYTHYIEVNGIGYSSTEIDHPEYLLPTKSFLRDYSFLDGKYVWREDNPLKGIKNDGISPEIVLLCLKYGDDVYEAAKQTMMKEIQPYNDTLYRYDDYVFYENSNFIELTGSRRFPEYFTMSFYNDSEQSLMFLGMYSETILGSSCIDDIYINDIDGNWKEFIDTYYGEYFNFGE